MLIRSSLLQLTHDQVFLFDVERSTSSYCMREYKHAYCSIKAIVLLAVYRANLEFQSHVPFQHLRMHVICFQEFAHAQTPRVLHFSAFIFHVLLHLSLLLLSITISSMKLNLCMWKYMGNRGIILLTLVVLVLLIVISLINVL